VCHEPVVKVVGHRIGLRLGRALEIDQQALLRVRERHHLRELIVDVFVFYVPAASFAVIFHGLRGD
jgi:phosphoglycerate dehydrogenase-like enzyme